MHRQSRARRIWLPLALTAALLGLIAIRFRPYFDLNDDFLMDRILNGGYTGDPESRNIQSLYPLTAALSGLFHLIRGIDWYAVFLYGAQAVCIFLVLYRIASLTGRSRAGGQESHVLRRGSTALWLLLAVSTVMGELLYHLVFVQYSVTVGIMAAAVIFLIMTEDFEGLVTPSSVGQHKTMHTVAAILRRMLPELVLVFLGFALRSEMMLFLSPMIALAVVIRGVQVYCLPSGNWRHFFLMLLSFGAAAVLGCGILGGMDLAACSSPAWRSFEAFFDARTQLYDFQRDWMKSYDDDKAFYDSIGLDRTEVELLWNYNFGLDEDITAGVVQKVADHAAQNAQAMDPPQQRIREALYDYRVRLLAPSERPCNMIAAVLYGLVLLQAFFTLSESLLARSIAQASFAGKTRGAAQAGASMAGGTMREDILRFVLTLLAVAALFGCRSVEFLYLLYHHRPVVRLTHCLYLCEAVILLCLIFTHALESRRREAVGAAVSVLLILVMLLSSGMQYSNTSAEYGRRAEVNPRWNALLGYVQDHPSDYYFIDVYSTVDFSEKMFDNTKVMAANWDFAGGWAAKSPLWDKKLREHGLTSMESGLVDSDHVYFISAADRDTGWIEAYYSFRGEPAAVHVVDTIGDDFVVCQVRRQGGNP